MDRHKASQSMVPSVSIVLPTYNEADNIVPLLTSLQKCMDTGTTEILVVDDASPDGTARKVREAVKVNAWKNVSILERTEDRGLTNSIRDGIAHTTGAIVVWMDCDFSHPPDLVPVLVREVVRGKDAAVASRFAPDGKQKTADGGHGDSSTAIGLSTALNVFLKILFRFDFHDYTSGYIAIRRSVLETLPLRGDYGEYFIDLMCRFFFAGHRVSEIPYESPPRRFGTSKTGSDPVSLIRHGFFYFATVFRVIIEHGIGRG